MTAATVRKDDREGTRHWTVLVGLGLLLVLLALHIVTVILDFRAGLHSPLQLDYGEGIVWQQAALIPGPHMYSGSQNLPFIVFHYPPLYYLIVHALAPLAPSLLTVGRLVSAAATVLIGALTAALVLTAAQRPGRKISGTDIATAIVAGLMVLSIHAVRTWGLFMRVDMVAVAFGLSGVLAAAWSNGRFWGTVLGLLLCLAAVFTKQTQLPAGVAVFTIAFLRRPRNALVAAAIVGAVGIGAVIALQAATDGGFLLNIVGYNINRLSLGSASSSLHSERDSGVMAAAIVIAAGATLMSVVRSNIRQTLDFLREADRAMTTRAILLVHFGLATAMLTTLFKSGASFNYLLDWLCVGGVLVGVVLCDWAGNWRRFVPFALLLVVGVTMAPMRELADSPMPEKLAVSRALIQRIAEAPKPVASEDMALLMQAGKPVIYEPAIVTELALLGKWDETPLVDMIRSGGFAFMITTDDAPWAERRTPAVDAAMREAYPRIEQAAPNVRLHLPADAAARN